MPKDFPDAIVILAGGIGKRFGSYKIVFDLGGYTLIEDLINRVRLEVDEPPIYISIKFIWQEKLIKKYVESANFIYDSGSVEGPLSGILSAIKRLRMYKHIALIPGDNLWINREILSDLYGLVREGCAVSSPVVNGYVDTLSMVVNRSQFTYLFELLNINKPIRPSDIHRGSSKAGYIEYSIYGIADLDSKPENKLSFPRIMGKGKIYELSKPQREYWTAINALINGKFKDASIYFHREHTVYNEYGLNPLAIHALKDSKYVLRI